MAHKELIVEEITYPHGGKLIIYNTKRHEYIPSQNYTDYVKSLEYKKNPIPKFKQEIIQRKALDKLMDNFIPKFNFTYLLKRFKRK